MAMASAVRGNFELFQWNLASAGEEMGHQNQEKTIIDSSMKAQFDLGAHSKKMMR